LNVYIEKCYSYNENIINWVRSVNKMSKCRLKTGCGWDKKDKRCCDDCRKKNIACSKACELECKNIKVEGEAK
jgi:hypothetical protein